MKKKCNKSRAEGVITYVVFYLNRKRKQKNKNGELKCMLIFRK